jgi:mannose/fructose/N-acetylgalactosamine-specific phosphotransferase system component IIC
MSFIFQKIFFLLGRPLLIPIGVAGVGLFYGSEQITYSTLSTVLSIVTEKNEKKTSKPTIVPFGIGLAAGSALAVFRTSKLTTVTLAEKVSAPTLRYHITTVASSGVLSGIVRAIIKII